MVTIMIDLCIVKFVAHTKFYIFNIKYLLNIA